MQTKHGISIDVLNANTPGRVPLNVLLEGGITLVRIPHGPFKIRVNTPHQTDVEVTLDDKSILTCQIQPGLSELERGVDGRSFAFTPADTTSGAAAASFACEAVPADSETAAENVVLEGDAVVTEKPEARKPAQPPHISGFLVVSCKFTEKPPIPGELPLPYDEQEAAFQMNPPAEHALAIAANFHKIVPPEKIERRWCSHCRRMEG